MSEATVGNTSNPGQAASLGARSAELAVRLARERGVEVEAYEKRGRSRRIERDGEEEVASTALEQGWAVRLGDLRRSGFGAGSGELPDAPEIETSEHPLWLPEPGAASDWTPPPGLDAALTSENELRALLDAVARELARELAGARCVAARLEEGASESALASSRGVVARAVSRLAALRCEATHAGQRVRLEAWARTAAELKPLALARRLADRLLALAGETAPRPGRLLLAAPLAARLVEALAPWLVGREAAARAAALTGTDRPLAASSVDLVDDGALAGGLLAAAADGEGVACRATTLVEAGRFVRPLVAWWEAERAEEATGCARRASWRDPPRRAPTHLFLAPDAGRAVAELLGEATAYLLEAEGAVRVDPTSGRFEVAVSGWVLDAGRAAGGLGRRILRGRLSDAFAGIVARARDLTFVAGDGMFGSPTWLVEGLELLPARAAESQPVMAASSPSPGSAGRRRRSSRPVDSGSGTKTGGGTPGDPPF